MSWQITQLLVKENLALTKSTGQKVHTLNTVNSSYKHAITNSQQHAHTLRKSQTLLLLLVLGHT